jgi:putative membrane-bound dehydrogenase-like protein
MRFFIHRVFWALSVYWGCTLYTEKNPVCLAQDAVVESMLPAPLSPVHSMATMRIADGLEVRLVAAEPMVQDPVAVCWDAHGAMYVAEMGDYPAQSDGGRVRRLTDEDQDGVMDQATVFADGLAYPTSVLPYRDGVLVAAAPDIWWLRDTDHDGVADQRSVVLTGFGQGNQQLRANGLTWGLDGWVYGANGRSDGELRVPNRSQGPADQSLSIRNRDFRFEPDQQLVETTGGFSQFGLSFDDFGNRFISWNTIHIRHVVMEQSTLSRNPLAPITATMAEMSLSGSTPRVFPISRTTRRFNAEPPGYFNASCGLSIYRGDLLPAEYHGNAFACEPLSNLVHRDVLFRAGSTFVAQRAEEEMDREFLAASDPWFRPVNTATGPDGAFYVVDFYRPWVEHPQWVADEQARNSVDFSVGKEYGRLYRVIPHHDLEGTPHPRDLSELSDAELLRLLGHPNAWQRETAQRLLRERGTVNIADVLELLQPSNNASEFTRLHAYALLQGFQTRYPELRLTLVGMLSDPSANIRRLGAAWLDTWPDQPVAWQTAVLPKLFLLLEDDDPRVRLQAASALTRFAQPQVASQLAKLFIHDGDDSWMRQAMFSALHQRVSRFVEGTLAGPPHSDWISQTRLEWLLQVVESSARDELPQWEQLLRELGDNADAEHRFWRGLIALGVTRGKGSDWLAKISTEDAALRQWLDRLPEYALTSTDAWERLLAIGMMEYQDQTGYADVLAAALSATEPLLVQQWSARATAGQLSPQRTAVLLGALKTSSPGVRRTILDRFIARQELASQLAKAIVAGQVPLTELDNLQRQLLLQRLAPDVRQTLEAASSSTDEDQQELIGRYVQAYDGAHDIQLGQQLFLQHCQSCHALGAVGHRIGPDLTAVAGRSPSDIIVDILDPNRSVSADGYGYALLTQDDEVLSGVIAGETDTSVTILRPGGEMVSVVREEIQELRYLGKSLMPEGFQRALSPIELASLVAFLKSSSAVSVDESSTSLPR